MKKISKSQRGIKIKTFLLDVTTLHGLKYLVSENKIWASSWALIIFGNVLFTSYLIVVIKERFQKNQVYTTIDATCRVNQVPFPSVAICNRNLVSLKETKNIENILNKNGFNKSKIHNFFAALPQLLKFFNVERDDELDHYKDILTILKSHYFNLDIIMEEVHQKCENLLLYCSFNRKVKRCDDMFTLIKTIEGHCCAFNYAALNDASEDPNINEDDEEELIIDKRFKETIATSESGRTSGLTVILDIEPKDYPDWTTANFYGAKVLLFDPSDYPEVSVYKKYVSAGESLDLKVAPEIYRSEDELKRVEADERGCWFDDDVKLVHTDYYSYETCTTECKMNNYLNLCGCLPYKYPRETTSRICEFSDGMCLKNLTVTGISKLSCNCHVECNDRSYAVKRDVMPFLIRDYPAEILTNVNTSQVISLKVYYVSSNCKCYITKLVIDFNSLIATFGGFISLSMGGSLLVIFEIIYLIASCIIKKVKVFFN